jgi:ferritin-like metal-binding protein YciE
MRAAPIARMMRGPTRKTLLMRPGVRRELFIDRLCERWLFERCACALYERVLPRLRAEPQLTARLRAFAAEERTHVEMIEALLAVLGRRPRQEPATPAVNVAATEAEALLELARGPELTPRHLLQVLLAAERIDGGGWEHLVELGRQADLDDEWLRSFRAAARVEAEHLHVLTEWFERVEREELVPTP